MRETFQEKNRAVYLQPIVRLNIALMEDTMKIRDIERTGSLLPVTRL